MYGSDRMVEWWPKKILLGARRPASVGRSRSSLPNALGATAPATIKAKNRQQSTTRHDTTRVKV